MNKKLLVVSYYFPPYGEVGGQRVAKFVKYLSRLGWDITVLTVQESCYQNLNKALLDDVRIAKIIRTGISKPIAGIKEWGLFWKPKLRRELENILSQERFNVAFWTGNPFYQMTLAPYLKKKYGLSYVIDMRDPWRLNPYGNEGQGIVRKIKFRLDKLIAAVLEPRIMWNAEKVINVTEEATAMYRQFYRSMGNERFITIGNGYDPEDLENIAPKKMSRFDIVYSGKFGTFRDPMPFFRALKKLVLDKGLTPEDIRFVWIGTPENAVLEMIRQSGIGDFVTQTGFMPYKENIAYVKGASACLLISGVHPYEPTTKVFDYIGCGKPVLGILGAKGFLSALLEKYGRGYLCGNNEQAVHAAICAIYEKGAGTAELTAGEDELRTRFSRRFGAEALDSVLAKYV